MPLDPFRVETINKPSKFEPPTNDPGNSMSYVLAFDETGAAKDVTGRYAKAYHAKTRKSRVEITSGGEEWWGKVLRYYSNPYDLVRNCTLSYL
jgi:xeroderma pigmentosum group C-complementing protein